MPQPEGRGGGQPFPVGWNSSNRRTTDRMLTDWCMITRADLSAASGFDRGTGGVSGPSRTLVVSNLRCAVEVHGFQSARDATTGQQRVTMREYEIEIPWSWTDVRVDDLLEVTASQDLGLVGRVFRVLSVEATSQQWSRVLRAQADEG